MSCSRSLIQIRAHRFGRSKQGDLDEESHSNNSSEMEVPILLIGFQA